ncbi:hypothetical protein ACU5DF_23780 [Aliivibrio wodanis]|uniref:hypothetical protein n=1 Tax=Aliivibrio wodanis TaxID=80852 RepID=UPI00406BFD8F
MKFSYWFHAERVKAKQRINIGDAVKLYAKQDDIKDSATTVKLSFEAIKRAGKLELATLISKQMIWRFNNDIASISYVFEPLNTDFYQKVRESLDGLIGIVGSKGSPETYGQFIEWLDGIDQSLENKNMPEYLEAEFGFKLSRFNSRDSEILEDDLRKVIMHRKALSVLILGE